jgi:hypothetical protein
MNLVYISMCVSLHILAEVCKLNAIRILIKCTHTDKSRVYTVFKVILYTNH